MFILRASGFLLDLKSATQSLAEFFSTGMLHAETRNIQDNKKIQILFGNNENRSLLELQID